MIIIGLFKWLLGKLGKEVMTKKEPGCSYIGQILESLGYKSFLLISDLFWQTIFICGGFGSIMTKKGGLVAKA